ncbi:uncharacterized protein LOC126278140 [Schistocerca gregaria]|uniref:uncharacterized protein LOC126278140 n=1 Tax=Schistocerca gregaria TaxID=7010 RepID=UPI00211EF019|nr:uncharacterized protein LOC126278140 [Schistocerca gregaria]
MSGRSLPLLYQSARPLSFIYYSAFLWNYDMGISLCSATADGAEDTESENEAVHPQLPSMNLRLVDIDGASHSGSNISQDKTFSCNTPTDELHQMLKTSSGLEFDDIESIYLSTNKSMLSAEGFEEFDAMLSDTEFQESSELKENKAPSFKTLSSNTDDISETCVSSSAFDHVKSAHSSCSKSFYSPSSHSSHSQDMKKSLPEISAIEKIQVWMKTVPDPKSETSNVCEKLVPKLHSAGNDPATILYTIHSSDLSPNTDSCHSVTNNKECSLDQHSSEKSEGNLNTSSPALRKDENISELHETDSQHDSGDNISDSCSRSDNIQQLTGDQHCGKSWRITDLNAESKSGEENGLDVFTSLKNDESENSLYNNAHRVSNFDLRTSSSIDSVSVNAQQSSEKHVDSVSVNAQQSSEKHVQIYKRSSLASTTEDENISSVCKLYTNGRINNISSTSGYDLLNSGLQSSATDNQEIYNNQQYRERLLKAFDTSGPSGNENLSDAGPSVVCGKTTDKSCNYQKEQPLFDVINYPHNKLTNRTTDCLSPSSSEFIPMCNDTVYTNSCKNIKLSAFNEIPSVYSETSNEILDDCDLLPQQDRFIEHMSVTQSSSKIFNTVVIECTEDIPLPSAGDLGANVVEFSAFRGNHESKEVYCAYKIVKSDSQYSSCIPDEDHHVSNVLEGEHCRNLSVEQSSCNCCEHCRKLSAQQSGCKFCETSICDYNEEQDISSTGLWAPPANSADSICCINSHLLQCEECSLTEVSTSASNQMEMMTLREMLHIQEPIMSQEIRSSPENRGSTDPQPHCVSQQATINQKRKININSGKKAQKNKSNRRRKGKNKRLCMRKQRSKTASKPRFNKQDIVASVVRLDVSDFNGDLELTLL